MAGNSNVTFKGQPMTLKGEGPEVGQTAPGFTATGQDLAPVKLDDFAGQPLILVSVPSLDTSVCSLESRRFNDEAKKLDGAKVLVVSMDLPFAQKRWADENEVRNLVTASDYKDHSFAQAYGLLIEDLGLLARTVLVLDKDHRVVHKEIVREVTEEPHYDVAIDAVKKVM